MRAERFTEFLTQRLREADNPGVSGVDTYHVNGVDWPQPVVRCADGSAIYLHVVRASPSGGEDFTQPEKVVERPPGVEISVRHREI